MELGARNHSEEVLGGATSMLVFKMDPVGKFRGLGFIGVRGFVAQRELGALGLKFLGLIRSLSYVF